MSVTTNQVQRVMRSSGYARAITTFVLVTVLAAFAVAMFAVITGLPSSNFRFSINAYVFSHDSLQSLPVKVWILTFATIATVLATGFLYLLRSVFANLARGEIFCEANVRNIRHMGSLLIAGGMLAWLTPLANATFFMFVGHDGIEMRDVSMISGGLAPFAYGGMLILLSWIMAVGLGVREDAETLRRDAELVI